MIASSVSATEKILAPSGIFFSFRPPGIPGTVEVFLVRVNNLASFGQERNFFEHLISVIAVLAHNGALVIVQLAGFTENVIRDRHLADVVEKRPACNHRNLFAGNSHGAGNGDGEGGDAARGAFGF